MFVTNQPKWSGIICLKSAVVLNSIIRLKHKFFPYAHTRYQSNERPQLLEHPQTQADSDEVGFGGYGTKTF